MKKNIFIGIIICSILLGVLVSYFLFTKENTNIQKGYTTGNSPTNIENAAGSDF